MRCLAALLLLAFLGGCGSPSASSSPAPSPPSGPRPPDHVVVVVFENKTYEQVATAPYLSGLMARAATFTDAHGVAHPSQPNYLALFSGSTQGVTDDHCPVRLGGAPNLGQQLIAHGLTFTGYAEDLPSAGYTGCASGGYAAKHNPWVDFSTVPARANQPYSAWPDDFGRLPTVAFVVPNLCHDMHDCSVSVGDAWARDHLDPYVEWASTHRSLLVITFDENDDSPGNQILTLVAGAGVHPGPRSGRVDHYSVLRTIEDLYGLPPLGAASSASPLSIVDG